MGGWLEFFQQSGLVTAAFPLLGRRYPFRRPKGELKIRAALTQQKPRILVVNDDRALLVSRKLLLESSGADVVIACGLVETSKVVSTGTFDLTIIDVTNVSVEHGVMLCGLVKAQNATSPIALLIAPEMDPPTLSDGTHVIFRDGPKSMLAAVGKILNIGMSLS